MWGKSVPNGCKIGKVELLKYFELEIVKIFIAVCFALNDTDFGVYTFGIRIENIFSKGIFNKLGKTFD